MANVSSWSKASSAAGASSGPGQCYPLPSTAIFPPWEPSEWRPVNDTVRGGKSESHLVAAGKAVRFWGNLDITALGGAGFASQVHTFGPAPLHLPPGRYQGVVLCVTGSRYDEEGESSKPHKPSNYTLSFKNVLPKRRPDGRNESVINYESHFSVPSGSTTIAIPFKSFEATYRGRKIDHKDPMYKPFDSGSIVEASIMCRSDFGDQAGPFDITIDSISGWLLDERKGGLKEKAAKPQGPSPASLSHFVIFNPSLEPDVEANKLKGDEKDDAREAAQIIYYSSNEGGSVSRDKMLRQVGLAKGLMGFAAMLVPESQSERWHAVKSYRQRLVLLEPENGWWIHAVIVNETVAAHSAGTSSTTANSSSSKPSSPAPVSSFDPHPSQRGLTDQVLKESLEAGYSDFVLLNGTFSHILDSKGRPALERAMERFWTRWAWEWGVGLADGAGVSRTLSGYPSPNIPNHKLVELLEPYRPLLPAGTTPLIFGPSGPFTPSPSPPLTRYLYQILSRSLPKAVQSGNSITAGVVGGINEGAGAHQPRVSSWNPFGKSSGWMPIASLQSGTLAPVTSKPEHSSRENKKRWPGLGLGSMASGMESVGAVFGLGGGKDARAPAVVKTHDLQTKRTDERAETEINEGVKAEDYPLPPSPDDSESFSIPVQSEINVSDLTEAISDVDPPGRVPLEWCRLEAWLPRGTSDESLEQRNVCWIIREGILLALVLQTSEDMDNAALPGDDTLHLMSALSKLAADSSAASENANKTSNSGSVTTIHYAPSQSMIDIQPAGGLAASSAVIDQELSELREMLHQPNGPIEVLVRTQDSKFLVAKRSGSDQAMVVVGRRDSNIVDADHALRVFAKSHTEFAS